LQELVAVAGEADFSVTADKEKDLISTKSVNAASSLALSAAVTNCFLERF
jgi:hypothetical protein